MNYVWESTVIRSRNSELLNGMKEQMKTFERSRAINEIIVE